MTSRGHHIDRREFIRSGTVLGLSTVVSPNVFASQKQADDTSIRPVRFGLNADPHLMGRRTPGNESNFLKFVVEMKHWQPDFAIDLGDFGCQAAEGTTTQAMHDDQLKALKHHVEVFDQVPCKRYHVMGNHDVGWLRGGTEKIKPQDLIGQSHGGEDITKDEFLAATGMTHRYFSFDVNDHHFIVLDGNNWRDKAAMKAGHDGVVGGYYIDPAQITWLKKDLADHRSKPKVVFCHEELHHTPKKGSGQGGDAPFPAVGKESSYVDNGWQIRELFAKDRRVQACFFGHKHRSRWTVYHGTHYLTMAATHWKASYAAVTINKRLFIKGFGDQRTYDLPLKS